MLLLFQAYCNINCIKMSNREKMEQQFTEHDQILLLDR
jgi:hypothetical protein